MVITQIQLTQEELKTNYDDVLRLLQGLSTTDSINTLPQVKVAQKPLKEELDKLLPQQTVQVQTVQVTKNNLERLKDYINNVFPTLTEKQQKSMNSFFKFYETKINSWKDGVNIDALWNKWVSTDKNLK